MLENVKIMVSVQMSLNQNCSSNINLAKHKGLQRRLRRLCVPDPGAREHVYHTPRALTSAPHIKKPRVSSAKSEARKNKAGEIRIPSFDTLMYAAHLIDAPSQLSSDLRLAERSRLSRELHHLSSSFSATK